MTRATRRARVRVTAATFVTSLTVFTAVALFAGVSLAFAPGASAITARTSSPDVATHPHSAGSAAKHESAAVRRRQAHAARAAHEARLIQHHNQLAHEVIHEARAQRGKPYVYGADGPGAFDCSGLVRYVYEHSVHRSLPHNAAEQYHSLRHIKRRHLRPGDLVFTDDGYISHVGIFAGHHHWWVAPHTGTHVQLQRIYHAHFVYARVLIIHKHRR